MSFLFLVTTQSIAEDNNILLIYFPHTHSLTMLRTFTRLHQCYLV